MEIEAIASVIVDTAYHVHVGLGPGLLESVYHVVFGTELERRGLDVERHLTVPFEFNGIQFDNGLRLDLLVNKTIIIELKSVEELAPVHYKQLLTYLRLMNLQLGFLINFGAATFKQGIKRVVNGYTGPSRLGVFA